MSLLTQPYVQPRFPCKRYPTFSASCRTQKTAITKTEKVFFSESFDQTRCTQPLSEKKKRVFFLDVNPLCYEGSKPSLRSFGRWLSLFLHQVSLTDPVIAVISLTLFVCERMNLDARAYIPFGSVFSYQNFKLTLLHPSLLRSNGLNFLMNILKKVKHPSQLKC